jgi:sugar lactone lactonase YvrE
MKKTLCRSVFLCWTVFAFLCVAVFPASASAASGDFTKIIPTADQWYITGPNITVDKDGNIYTADGYIAKYNAQGTFQMVIKSYGSYSLDNLSGIAVDAAGNIYALDFDRSCIVKFDAGGNYLSKWGANGSGSGQFGGQHATDQAPADGLAFDAAGNLYVADTYNNRIQVFKTDGTFVNAWGAYGSGDGQFDRPSGIDFDSAGNIYVAEWGNHRVQKFDASGTFLKKWGIDGYQDGQLNTPDGIAAGQNGHIYIADQANYRMIEYTADGDMVRAFSQESEAAFGGVATASDGSILASVSNSVRAFSQDGQLLKKWQNGGSEEGFLREPEDVVTDSAGNIYVADSWNCFISKFDGNGQFIKRWDTRGTAGGDPENGTVEIAIDSKDNIYAVNFHNNRVVKFNANGDTLLQWGTQGTGSGQFTYPSSIYVDRSDRVYVGDGGDRIQVFDANGTYTGTLKASTGKNIKSGDIGFDLKGNLYVLAGYKVYKYGPDMKLIKSWGGHGSSSGHIDESCHMIVDDVGYVYVSDCRQRIQVFDMNGKYKATWGKAGFLDNQFNLPLGMWIANNGFFYAVDSGNNRVMRKAFSKPVIQSFSISPDATYGFTPGGSNELKINGTFTSVLPTTYTAVVYNTEGKWVASVKQRGAFSGAKALYWNGKATSGNAAGLPVGNYVPSSDTGTDYKIRIKATYKAGKVYSSYINFKVYTAPAITNVSVSPLSFKAVTSGVNKTKAHYTVSRMTNVELRFYNTKNKKRYAVYKYTNRKPNTTYDITWNGKTTKGNTAGLTSGKLVPAGDYKLKIMAGGNLYYSQTIHVSR